jgi:hypothetical protein
MFTFVLYLSASVLLLASFLETKRKQRCPLKNNGKPYKTSCRNSFKEKQLIYHRGLSLQLLPEIIKGIDDRETVNISSCEIAYFKNIKETKL